MLTKLCKSGAGQKLFKNKTSSILIQNAVKVWRNGTCGQTWNSISINEGKYNKIEIVLN